MLQRRVGSGWPALTIVALKGCGAPSSTAAMFGVIWTTISLTIETVAVADFAGSAALVAVTCTLAGDGKSAGAVYAPAVVMVPEVAVPPGTPFTFQVTAVLAVPVTAAVKVCVLPRITEPVGGL